MYIKNKYKEKASGNIEINDYLMMNFNIINRAVPLPTKWASSDYHNKLLPGASQM